MFEIKFINTHNHLKMVYIFINQSKVNQYIRQYPHHKILDSEYLEELKEIGGEG